jgi:hypothetical protein
LQHKPLKLKQKFELFAMHCVSMTCATLQYFGTTVGPPERVNQASSKGTSPHGSTDASISTARHTAKRAA